MNDLISRQAVEEIINDIRDCISVEGYWAIFERMKKLPPVNPQPKTGYWIYYRNKKGDYINKCSTCGQDCGVGYPYNFCPNCGTKMESEV